MKVEFFSSSGGGGGGTTISLTTTGTSGASTLSGTGVLNIPIYADENTNIGNTNLVSNATTRTYGIANGGTLTFKTFAGTNALQVNNSGDVVVGGATPYTMPNARGTSNEVLGLTDNSGNVEWRTITPTILVPQQTLAVAHFLTPATLVANNVYVPQNLRLGSWLPLGLSTITSVNAGQGQPITLTTPFRQLSNTNIRLEGTMNIKFASDVAGIYDFFIIRVNMGTGVPTGLSPVAFTLIGSSLISAREVGEWKCLELTTNLVLGSACTSYYLGIAPRQSQSEKWQCIANYTQSSEVNNQFS